MRVKDAVGRFGEQIAAQHLEAAGFTILGRNWRCRQGELDLIARDGTDLVFIEVKTRSSLAFGSPMQAINAAKAARIRRLAAAWLAEARGSGTESNPGSGVVRFDVVGVLRHRGGGVEVEHLRGVL